MNLKSKKVLVTGADGFIGSHLVEALLSYDVMFEYAPQPKAFVRRPGQC
jgi:thioester reductase-like protein